MEKFLPISHKLHHLPDLRCIYKRSNRGTFITGLQTPRDGCQGLKEKNQTVAPPS